MDMLIISNENNILHIFNKGYSVDYTFYNCKGHSLDGGILESSKEKFNINDVKNEIINMFKDSIDFTEPYMFLEGERADGLLELIEMEDYKNTQLKVDSYLSSIKKNSYIEVER